jgi:hypothetical protein
MRRPSLIRNRTQERRAPRPRETRHGHGASLREMRGARVSTPVWLVALFVVVGLMSGGCAGGGASSSASDVTPITEAAYLTTRGPGFRMALSMTANIGEHPFVLNADGAFDEHGTHGAMTETVNGKTVTSIFKLPYGYIRANGKLVRGKPWVRFNIEGYARTLGVSGSLDTNADPSQWIDYLKAAGQATTVGRQALRGVSTTRYHVLVDLTRYLAVVPAHLRALAQQQTALVRRFSGQNSLPVDVWIDLHKRVRRYQIEFPLCFEGEKTSESVSVELYDYGRQTIVQPPASSEVSDITSAVAAGVSHALQQAHC